MLGFATLTQSANHNDQYPNNDKWTNGLGPLRTAFDINDFCSVPGLHGVSRVMDSYNTSLAVPDSELGMVVVIRHVAVPMVLDSSAWVKFRIGSDLLPEPLSESNRAGNTFAPEIARLRRRGVKILACGSALAEFANEISRRRRIPLLSVRKAIQASLLPGIVVVTNGLYALARAQNVGCGVIR